MILQYALNIVLTSVVLSTVLWISKSNPILGGFIVALPISTLLVLAFSKIQNGDVENTFLLAKSIFLAVPLTLLFFVPFLVAERLRLSFWSTYASGCVLLVVGFFAHGWLMSKWTR